MKHYFWGILFALSLAIFSPFIVQAQSSLTTGSEVQLVNPIGGSARDGGNKQGTVNINIIIGNAIKVVLGIVGSISLLVFVFGGYQLLTSAGDDSKVRMGSNAMLYATIGLFIIFGAYAILNTILKGIAR